MNTNNGLFPQKLVAQYNAECDLDDATEIILRSRINRTIGTRIISLVCEGSSLRDAFDAVLGSGQYDALAETVYNDLRSN